MSEMLRTRGDLVRTIGPEAAFYLDQNDQVTEEHPESFAVIKIGGEMAQGDSLDQLSGAVSHLTRLGYFPTLVHGGGPQINKLFAREGIEPEVVEGLRVTPPETMELVEEALTGVNTDIRQSLKNQGVVPADMGRVFEAELIDEEKLGMVGAPTDVNTQWIKETVRGGRVPVISCLGKVTVGETYDKSVNINGDDAAAKLVEQLQPKHYFALTGLGGVIESGKIVSVITPDIAGELIMGGVITDGMLRKVLEARKLIDRGITDDVVLATPGNMIRELFTHEGAGSLITKGESIRSYDGLDGVAVETVKSLIENAFGGHLSEGYFEQSDIVKTYVTSQTYDGVAIMRQPEHISARYMDKLAVAPRAQGRGMARQIVDAAAQDGKSGIFWRADPSAVFLPLYDKIADERSNVPGPKGAEWRIFCKNMLPQEIEKAMAWAAAQPVTIDRHPKDAPF